MNADEIFKKVKTVYNRLADQDIYTLTRYAFMVPVNGIIVDIGTFQGGSAFTMALASDPTVKVYTIDPSYSDSFIRQRKEFGLEDRIVYIQKTSEDASKGWDKPIDLVFIDGIHSDPGVQQDLQFFGVHVEKGGYILAHDWHMYIGIREALERVEKENFIERIEIAESTDNGKQIGIYVGRKI